ncbi:hypothetical protein SEPCBS119000_006176 [Sporothrix epigloea]|uniref:Uncharacterized protein n=1 Tax=Sporothrix epigloea TaxID=1892477 RepID=A0ABP0E1K5_9PEZI
MAATHTFSPSIAPPSFALASSQANNLVQSSSKPSPFDMNFGTHLADFHIHRFYATPAPNLEELKAAVAVPRPPLSLSEFSESDFKAFSNSVRDAGTLREILYDVIPMLTGSEVSHYVTAQDVVFNNLRPLTDGCIAAARPHLYDGASPVTDHKAIRDQLGDMIVPSTAEGTPVVPNFFLEVADHANVEAARLQARFHGAIGARAMHSLQNFGK